MLFIYFHILLCCIYEYLLKNLDISFVHVCVSMMITVVSHDRTHSYYAMFLFGQYVGYVGGGARAMAPKSWRRFSFALLSFGVLGIVAAHFASSWSPAHRAVVNLTYIVGNLSIALALIGFCVLVQILLPLPHRLTAIMRSMDKNMLIIFLVANILVGVANLSIRTVFTSTPAAFFYIYAYICAVCAFSFALDAFGIRIKLHP